MSSPYLEGLKKHSFWESKINFKAKAHFIIIQYVPAALACENINLLSGGSIGQSQTIMSSSGWERACLLSLVSEYFIFMCINTKDGPRAVFI